MERPLSEHIALLERKIISLRAELRGTDLPSYMRDEKELELANAQEALKMFRRAYELEQKISN